MQKGNYKLLTTEQGIYKVLKKHTRTPGNTFAFEVQRAYASITFRMARDSKGKPLKSDENVLEITELVNAQRIEKNIDLFGGEPKKDQLNSLYTRFDHKPLSSRTNVFKAQIAELFVRDVLLQDVETEAGVSKQDAKANMALFILEDREHLSRYLNDPATFLSETEEMAGIELSIEEKAQFTQAVVNQDAILSLFDYAELGESSGDGDTYILVGTAVTNIPTIEAMMWLQQSLAQFIDRYGFLPAYGSYVTEAALRQRVIIGPDVTEREKKYIENNVFDPHDYRDGRQIEFSEFE
jgi:hypothetical protein